MSECGGDRAEFEISSFDFEPIVLLLMCVCVCCV